MRHSTVLFFILIALLIIAPIALGSLFSLVSSIRLSYIEADPISVTHIYDMMIYRGR
jgi:Tfp pilus assembly protein PilX